jgi:hypothetical protein
VYAWSLAAAVVSAVFSLLSGKLGELAKTVIRR